MTAAPEKPAGFTIIELLLAAALSALVLSSAYWAYTTILTGAARYREGSISFQIARVVLGALEREISGTYLPLLPGFIQEQDDLPALFVTDNRWRGGMESDRLDFVSTTFMRGGGAEASAGYATYELGYYLQDDKLMMRMAPFFNPKNPFQDGREIVLAEGIRALDFKYFDDETGEWADEWDLEEMEHLPRAVSVTIAVGDEDEEEPRRFSLSAWIPAGGSKLPPEETSK